MRVGGANETADTSGSSTASSDLCVAQMQATSDVWLYDLGTLSRADPATCTQCGWLVNVSFRPAARQRSFVLDNTMLVSIALCAATHAQAHGAIQSIEGSRR